MILIKNAPIIKLLNLHIDKLKINKLGFKVKINM